MTSMTARYFGGGYTAVELRELYLRMRRRHRDSTFTGRR
jgi:hypothetical protein